MTGTVVAGRKLSLMCIRGPRQLVFYQLWRFCSGASLWNWLNHLSLQARERNRQTGYTVVRWMQEMDDR